MKPETKEKLEKVVTNVDAALKLTEEKVGKPAASAVKGYEIPLAVAILLMLIVGLSMKMLIIGAVALVALTSPKWLPVLLEKMSKKEAPAEVEVKKEEEKKE
jgi:hypothetical protein